MTFTVQGASGSGNMQLYSGSFSGFLVNIDATSAPNPEGVDCQINLMNPDGNTQVVSGNLLALAKATTPAALINTQIPTTSQQYGYWVDLGQVINLHQGDQLNVKVNVSGGITSQTLTFCMQEGVGIGLYIPQMIVQSVDETRSTMSFSPGNNVRRIAIVQTNVLNIVTSATVQSDKWSANYTNQQFYPLIASQWNRTITDYSYFIYNGFPLNSVTMNITISSGNGNAYVVFVGGRSTKTVSQRAQELQKRIATTNAMRYNLNQDN